MKIIDKIESNTAFTAIRQGMISIIPLVVVSSMALMFKSLPIHAYQNFISTVFGGLIIEILDFVYSSVYAILAVILAIAISVSYAMEAQKKLNIRINFGDIIVLALITVVVLVGTLGIQYDTFEVRVLSNINAFMAMFASLVSGKIFFAIKKSKFFKFNKSGTINNDTYIGAIEGIVPAIIIIGVFIAIKMLLRIETIQDMSVNFINNIIHGLNNNFAEGLVVLLFTQLMWFFGVHGNNVIDSIIQHYYIEIGGNIYNKTFQDAFVYIGGCGAVLCLVIAIFLFSKKKNVKNIASLAASTVIFNISEIMVFGLPVILNPVFLIPFICLPVFNYVVSYTAIYLGFVPNVVKQIEWTTPVFLNGYEATGSWKAVVLQLLCIVVGIMMYKPFVRLFEKQIEKKFVNNVRMLEDTLKQDEENNRCVMYTEQQNVLGSIARFLAVELEEAIKRRELFMMYQPQVNIKEICIGAEALLRWKHPTAGYIYPPLLIQLAKEKGILSNLEEFILDDACGAICKIEKEIATEFKISVNLTNASLEWDGLEECIEKYVSKYHISSDRLWLEITERDAVSSSIDIVGKIKNIKNKGHKFIIDDFGMGHTSLLYLQTNQFDVLKLDGILTRDILENKRNSKIVASIAYLSRSLKFDIIAEYVATREQRDELADIGCYAFQGDLYSMPLDLETLIKWMKNNSNIYSNSTSGSKD